MNVDAQRQILASQWRAAAISLSVRVEAPYTLKAANGSDIPCVAYLPDFGGPKGVVVGHTSPPDYKTDQSLMDAAKSQGLFFSFIDFEAYKRYAEEAYKEALRDWGFFGDEKHHPGWMRKADPP